MQNNRWYLCQFNQKKSSKVKKKKNINYQNLENLEQRRNYKIDMIKKPVTLRKSETQ